MNYTKEAREVKQQYYGGYCEMCRNINMEILPYHAFTFEIYNELKKFLKEKNKK